MNRLGISIAASALVGFVGAGAPASADPYYVSNVSVSSSNGVFGFQIDDPNPDTLYYAGAITYSANPGTQYNAGTTVTLTTWCDDFPDVVIVGGQYQYYTESADYYLSPLGSTITHEIAGLAWYGDQNLGNGTLDAEVQSAIWELMYGYTDHDAQQQAYIDTTLIGINGANAKQDYANMLAAGDSYAEFESPTGDCQPGKITYLSGCQTQGQLVIYGPGMPPLDVPEPATLGLLGTALLGLSGMGARRRRKNG